MNTAKQVCHILGRGPFCWLRCALAILFVNSLVACPLYARGEMGGAEDPLRALGSGNIGFAIDLYCRVASYPENTVISPVSVSTCLGMVYAGARGETEAEMASALRFSLPQEPLHSAFAALQDTLRALDETANLDFSLDNGLWVQGGDDWILPSYSDLLRQHYSAESQQVDFRGDIEQARADINSWIGEQTRGRLPNSLGPGWGNPTPHLVVVSAVYFNGRWKHKFRPEATKDAPFFTAHGDTMTVQMMHTQGSFRYMDDETAQVIELPYKGRRASMLVVLPREGVGLGGVHEALTPQTLVDWSVSLANSQVSVWLPRFAIGFNDELRDELMAMGMRRAFSLQDADLTGMADVEEHCLSSVMHGAIIEVDERGTEAAAATVASTMLDCGPVERMAEFRADRPFLFIVRDRHTGSLLFMGRVERPEQPAAQSN